MIDVGMLFSGWRMGLPKQRRQNEAALFAPRCNSLQSAKDARRLKSKTREFSKVSASFPEAFRRVCAADPEGHRTA
jgi:hypothetical protein